MARWQSIEDAQPEFAAKVRELFEAGRHKTIATLRKDGSPRISGIECEFVDGELRFGSMPEARKGHDLRRDPRFALHGPDVSSRDGQGDRVAGRGEDLGKGDPGGTGEP